MQLLVLAALTLTTSLLRAPHGGARTMPPATAARAATAVASADDDLALYESMMEVAAAEDSALGRSLKQSLGVLTQALRLYGEDTVVTAFNGGKDAVVVLHLMRAALAQHRRQQPAEAGAEAGAGPRRQRVIFFEVKDEFPEVASFLHETAERYNLEVVRYAKISSRNPSPNPSPKPNPLSNPNPEPGTRTWTLRRASPTASRSTAARPSSWAHARRTPTRAGNSSSSRAPIGCRPSCASTLSLTLILILALTLALTPTLTRTRTRTVTRTRIRTQTLTRI